MNPTDDIDEPMVRDVMTSPVITVDPEAFLGDVARVLVEDGISGAPVMDHMGHVLGVISESDLLPKEEAPLLKHRGWFGGSGSTRLRDQAQAVTARQAMTAGAISVAPDTTVRAAAHLMDSRKLGRLLVVEEDLGLVGIVSRRDIIREFSRDDEELRLEVIKRLHELLGGATSRISVTAHGGVINLAGLVSYPQDLRNVPAFAAGTRGVMGVTNQLLVDEPTGSAGSAAPWFSSRAD